MAVDNRTFELMGTGTPSMPHMVPKPPDCYFLTTGAAMYRTAGGAAVQLTDCAPLGGCEGAVPVDATSIASLGPSPKDGTVLRGLPSKRTWEIVGGKRRETFIARLDAVDVDDGAIGLIPAEGPAPAPPAPEVFKPVISSGYKVFRTLHAVHVAEGARRAARLGRHRLLRRQAEGLPVQEGQAVPPEGHVPERLQPLVQEGQAQEQEHGDGARHQPAGARKQQVFKIRSRKLPVRTTQCAVAGAKFSRCS